MTDGEDVVDVGAEDCSESVKKDDETVLLLVLLLPKVSSLSESSAILLPSWLLVLLAVLSFRLVVFLVDVDALGDRVCFGDNIGGDGVEDLVSFL